MNQLALFTIKVVCPADPTREPLDVYKKMVCECFFSVAVCMTGKDVGGLTCVPRRGIGNWQNVAASGYTARSCPRNVRINHDFLQLPSTPDSGVARICCEEGQRLKLCYGAVTVDFSAGCSSCSMTNSFVTNAVLIERPVSCWHLHQLIWQTTQYLDSWLSDLEVEGARAPVPYSWRRHWRQTVSAKCVCIIALLQRIGCPVSDTARGVAVCDSYEKLFFAGCQKTVRALGGLAYIVLQIQFYWTCS